MPDGASVYHVDFTGSSYINNLVDGPITVTISDKNNAKLILGTYTVEKHTNEITTDGLTDLKANRENTVEAKLSFATYGNSKVVKMYYEFVNYETITHPKLDAIDTQKPESVEIKDGKFDGIVATNLTSNQAYDVYYVLEDEYGSRTTVLGPVTIAKKSENVTPFTKLKSVTFPDLTTDVLASLSATWDLETNNTPVTPVENKAVYTVTLYRGETAVATSVVRSANYGSTNTDKTLALNKFVKELNKPGIYKLGVVVEGNDEHTASEPAYSATREITQLKEVTNFTFDIDPTDGVILKWDTDYDITNDIAGYGLSIVSIDENGKETDVSNYTASSPKSLTSSSGLLASKDKKAHKFTSARSGVVYKATLVVKAKTGQSAVVNSEKAVTSEFFYIDVQGITVSATKPGTATLQFANGPIVVAGKEATYQVEVYEVQDLGGNHKNYNLVDTKSVTLAKNKDGNYLVDISGLNNTKKYVFRVKANVGEIEGISSFTTPELGILKEMSELSNLTVAKEAGEGKIFEKSSTVLSINGEDYVIAEYPGILSQMATLIDDTTGLKVGDKIVSFDGTTLKVDFLDKEETRDLTGKLSGLTLEVVGDKNEVTLTTTDAEKVVLDSKETPALFVITAVAAKSIVLNNGVTVKTTKEDGTQPVVVASGATVSINGMKVTSSSEDTKMALNSNNTIDVTPNAGANNLTFVVEGTTGPSSDKFVINFARAAGAAESKQQGNITINATKMDVTVKSNALIESNVVANLTDANLDISSLELAGEKQVSVTTSKTSGTAKVVGRYSAELPANVTFTNLPLKEYKAYTEITAQSSNASGVTVTNFEKVVAFLNSFGLNELENATITVANDGKVTLNFVKDTPETSVKGLK